MAKKNMEFEAAEKQSTMARKASAAAKDPAGHRDAARFHDAAAGQHRQAAEAAMKRGDHAAAGHHGQQAMFHSNASSEHGRSAKAKPASATKSDKLKAFADGAHEAAPRALKRGKKGGTYHESAGGKKVYTKG